MNANNAVSFLKLQIFVAGFLYKRGEVNKAFQRRYFVLKGNLLFYFETRLDKEPLGLIIVEGCTIELSLEPDVDNYCFKIVFNGNRSYILAADTQESMELWMKALTCAGYEYKRIIVSELQRQLQEIEDSRKSKMFILPEMKNSLTNMHNIQKLTMTRVPPSLHQEVALILLIGQHRQCLLQRYKMVEQYPLPTDTSVRAKRNRSVLLEVSYDVIDDRLIHTKQQLFFVANLLRSRYPMQNRNCICR